MDILRSKNPFLSGSYVYILISSSEAVNAQVTIRTGARGNSVETISPSQVFIDWNCIKKFSETKISFTTRMIGIKLNKIETIQIVALSNLSNQTRSKLYEMIQNKELCIHEIRVNNKIQKILISDLYTLNKSSIQNKFDRTALGFGE